MSEPMFPFGGFLQPITPEQKAQMEEMHARHEMEASDIRHRITSLWNELDQEHLYTLRLIMSSFATVEGKQTRTMASYYEGVASTQLELRFGVCPGCGKNHDEVFMQEQVGEADGIVKIAVETTPVSETPPWEFPEPLVEGKQMKGAVVPSLFPDPRNVPAELMPEDVARMEEYNLDDVRDEDTLKLLGFICKGCGKRYQSIEDRALRPVGVDGCDGCQHKAAWG